MAETARRLRVAGRPKITPRPMEHGEADSREQYLAEFVARYRRLFVAAAIVGLFAGATGGVLWPKVYESTAVVELGLADGVGAAERTGAVVQRLRLRHDVENRRLPLPRITGADVYREDLGVGFVRVRARGRSAADARMSLQAAVASFVEAERAEQAVSLAREEARLGELRGMAAAMARTEATMGKALEEPGSAGTMRFSSLLEERATAERSRTGLIARIHDLEGAIRRARTSVTTVRYPASLDPVPVNPRLPLVIALATIAMLFLAVGVAFGREFLGQVRRASL